MQFHSRSSLRNRWSTEANPIYGVARRPVVIIKTIRCNIKEPIGILAVVAFTCMYFLPVDRQVVFVGCDLNFICVKLIGRNGNKVLSLFGFRWQLELGHAKDVPG